jgi:hypothetical protein
VGCGPWAVSGRNSKEQEPSFVFSFSWKIENANWLKRKIEKGNFPLWVKFKKLNYFSAAKEKLFILQLICTNVVFNRRKRKLFRC